MGNRPLVFQGNGESASPAYVAAVTQDELKGVLDQTFRSSLRDMGNYLNKRVLLDNLLVYFVI